MTPIEEAALALYAADDDTVDANLRYAAHGCPPCSECVAALRDSARRQRAAENCILKAIRDARPRSCHVSVEIARDRIR